MTRLKQVRESKGISQLELARLAGVKAPTVCSLERKGIFDTRTAKKYAVALNCASIILLDGLD